MESAGLDDPWTEASLYAANSTDTMLDGKAYYCAMRGHQLTYEGLWHIKWPMHESWLAENGHEHDVEAKELAQTVATLLKKTLQCSGPAVICFEESRHGTPQEDIARGSCRIR